MILNQLILAGLFLGLILTPQTTMAESKNTYSKEEVAQRNQSQDCWLIIDKKVYDLSSYLPSHNKYGVGLEEFCGKDATLAWQTKGEVGRPHSRRAQIFLRKYKKGNLSETASSD